MLKPDLAGLHCEGIDIDFSPDLTSSVARRIFGKDFSASEDWTYLAYEEYSSHGRAHYCSLIVHHREKRPTGTRAKLHIHISIGQGKRPRFARLKVPKAFEALERAEGIFVNEIASVNVRYLYSKTKYKSLPSLPIYYPLAAFPQAEIGGVRMSIREKPTAKKADFSVIVDVAPDDEIFHNVIFEYKVTSPGEFVKTILDVSTAISQKFLEGGRRER